MQIGLSSLSRAGRRDRDGGSCGSRIHVAIRFCLSAYVSVGTRRARGIYSLGLHEPFFSLASKSLGW